MLLTPFTLADPVARPRKPCSRTTQIAQRPVVPLWLVAWAACGMLALFAFPALRGGGFGGLTVPFWLVAAPLVDIAWLTRSRWLGRLRNPKPTAKPRGKPAVRRRS